MNCRFSRITDSFSTVWIYCSKSGSLKKFKTSQLIRNKVQGENKLIDFGFGFEFGTNNLRKKVHRILLSFFFFFGIQS